MKSRPFDDIRALIDSFPQSAPSVWAEVESEFDDFSGPRPALGHWEDSVKWLAGWQGVVPPVIKKPLIAIFAGTHSVIEHYFEGDVLEFAKARVGSLTSGQAAIRGLAEAIGAALKVFDLGTDCPVPDMTRQETLSEEDCVAAMAFGMEVVADDNDIIALGNAGLGSTVAAAAIAQSLYGGAPEYWAGAQNGSAKQRIAAVKAATELQSGKISDPLECLRLFGGHDIAGLVGAMIAARHQNIPVILDGFVVCAAASVLHAVNPTSIAHCRAGHLTAEPAHGALLDRLGLSPLHDSGIAIGDGTGAVYAVNSLSLSAAAFATLTARA